MKVALLLLAVALEACSVKHVEPNTPSQRRADVLGNRIAWIADTVPILRYEPFFIYHAWKAAVEACSGIKRDGMPTFYVAPISPLASDGRIGFYAPDTRTVVLALGYERDQWIVSHEILHYLLELVIPKGRSGETMEETSLRSHPPEYFTQKCGQLVSPS